MKSTRWNALPQFPFPLSFFFLGIFSASPSSDWLNQPQNTWATLLTYQFLVNLTPQYTTCYPNLNLSLLNWICGEGGVAWQQIVASAHKLIEAVENADWMNLRLGEGLVWTRGGLTLCGGTIWNPCVTLLCGVKLWVWCRLGEKQLWKVTSSSWLHVLVLKPSLTNFNRLYKWTIPACYFFSNPSSVLFTPLESLLSTINWDFVWAFSNLSFSLMVIPPKKSKSFMDAICEDPPIRKKPSKSHKKNRPLIISEPVEQGDGRLNSCRDGDNDGSPAKHKVSDKGKQKLFPEPVAIPAQPEMAEEVTGLEGDEDLASYMEYLQSVRGRTQNLFRNCLTATLFGGVSDFNAVKKKIKSDWRGMVGEIEVVYRSHGWFDIRFANPIDLRRVWDFRPYHIGGQLVILLRWSPSFEPMTAPVAFMDLWVRIPKLPVEFISKDALVRICKQFNIGSFIRFDRLSHQKIRVSYTRFCANVDVTKLCGTIFIPSRQGGIEQLKVWYEDFPKGCGFCGADDHEYNECQVRVGIPVLPTVTIHGSPCRSPSVEPSEGWTPVSKASTPVPKNLARPSVKPYMSGAFGVVVEFKASNLSPSVSGVSISASSKMEAKGNKFEGGQPSSGVVKPCLNPQGGIQVSEKDPMVVCQATSEMSTPLFTNQNIEGNNMAVDHFPVEEEAFPEGVLNRVQSPDPFSGLEQFLEVNTPTDPTISQASYQSVLSLSANNSVVKMVGTLGITKSNSGSSKRRGSDNSDDAVSTKMKRAKLSKEGP